MGVIANPSKVRVGLDWYGIAQSIHITSLGCLICELEESGLSRPSVGSEYIQYLNPVSFRTHSVQSHMRKRGPTPGHPC